jgi:hypothetical protein
VGDSDVQKAVEKFKQDYGVDVRRFFSSVGDTWCVYNSPAEGEMAFFGWTAVVSVRDRAALLDSCEKLCALSDKAKVPHKNDSTGGKKDQSQAASDATPEFRKCRFAGHEIYYLAGQPIVPAFSISDGEMVMTLNMPAMKAYLVRKNHRSLATLPGVALALNDQNRPVALGYCDTPKLFDLAYPLFSLYANMGVTAAQSASRKFDLDPTFWPSAPAIRSHLRPEITTLQRTPHGLELTCRYCLPTGGANGPLCLLAMGTLGSFLTKPYVPTDITEYSDDAVPPTARATEQSSPPAPAVVAGGPARTSNGTTPNAYGATPVVGSPATTPYASSPTASPYVASRTEAPRYAPSPPPSVPPKK